MVGSIFGQLLTPTLPLLHMSPLSILRQAGLFRLGQQFGRLILIGFLQIRCKTPRSLLGPMIETLAEAENASAGNSPAKARAFPSNCLRFLAFRLLRPACQQAEIFAYGHSLYGNSRWPRVLPLSTSTNSR